jgi:Zn-dependent peptidase ImmA (M78 family)
MIGERLKLARAAAGLSLRDLEARMNGLVTAQAIGKYERDEMMPSSRVLLALARTLSVAERYLLKQSDLRLGQVEFRKKALTSAKDEASVRASVIEAVERYREVENLLAIDGTWVPPRHFPRTVSDVEGAEDAALELRKQWQLGLDPIPDLAALLEEHQLKVQVIGLPEDVSGLHATVLADGKPVIRVALVNAAHPGERQRFTLAHELAHVLLEVPGDKAGEKVCHRFASAFLMPALTVVREVGPRRRALPVRELFRLKALFGVSAQAVAYRCRDLGITSQAVFTSIFQYFGKRQWRKREPNELKPEKPLRFERLVMRALAEDVIGEAKAAELLSMSTWQLIEMLETPPSENGDDGEPAGL